MMQILCKKYESLMELLHILYISSCEGVRFEKSFKWLIYVRQKFLQFAKRSHIGE